MEQLLTPQQVADMLQIDITTLHRYTSQKRIPFLKLTGQNLRFRRAEIESWLSSRSVTPTAPAPKAKPRKKTVRRIKRRRRQAKDDAITRQFEALKVECGIISPAIAGSAMEGVN